MSGGLFGELDVDEVPNDPFYVAPDTYKAVLTEVNRVMTKDGSKEGLSFKWVIDEPDSEYNGNNVQDWKNIYPNITRDQVTPMVKKDNARLKQRLTEMGIPEEDMNSFLDDLDKYIGMEAYITVIEQRDKKDPDKRYTNISRIRLDV